MMMIVMIAFLWPSEHPIHSPQAQTELPDMHFRYPVSAVNNSEIYTK